LKLSMYAFCTGLPGSMNRIAAPAIERGLGDPVPAAEVGDFGALLVLAADDLPPGEATPSHQSSVD
jgi:hypothetical protein